MQIKYLTLGSLIALLLTNNTSHGDTARNTYIGIDYLYSTNKMQKDFGSNIFSQKKIPGLNFSLGHMYTEHIGGEIGLEINKIKKQIKDIPEQETVCGVPPNNPLQIFTRHKTKMIKNNAYLGLIAKSRIMNSNVFFSMLIGGTIFNIKAKDYIIGNKAILIGFVNENITYNFKKNKIIPIVKFVLEYKFNNKYHAKISYNWKQTSKIIIKSPEIYNNYLETIKLRNCYTIGLGISYFI